jgi:hypothetical protein
MFGVHQIGVFVFFQSFPFTVTLVAILSRDFAISENGVAVTFIARKSVIEDQCVVVARRLRADEDFLCVTVVTVIDLRIVVAFFEMTDKTRALCDSDVFPLHDLRVTACALEFFPSFQVLKVNFVVECDFSEGHLSFKESFIVTTFPETTFIADFCPGLGFDVELCPVTTDHNQAFDLFSQLGLDPASRGIMTNTALEIFMRGGFPTFKIGFHEMARGTKI